MKLASHKSLTVGALALLSAGALHAGEPLDPSNVSILPDPAPPSGGWDFEAILYGWFTGLKGDTGFNGNIASIDIGFDDISNNLDFAAFAALGASNGTWGFHIDGSYTKVSTDAPINGPLFRKVDISVWNGLGNFYGTYRVVNNPAYTLDLMAGARVSYSKTKLRFQENRFPTDVSGSESEAWVDAVGGLRGRWDINNRWFLNYMGDVGAGSSDLTWQLLGSVGYRFTDTWDIRLGYRYLSTDYEKGDQDFVYDLELSGAFLGLGVRW